MGKTFLMVCPITIKSDIMVMDKDTMVILRNSTLYSFVPFFRTGKVQGFSVWCRTDIYITAFSVFPGVRTVCMLHSDKESTRKAVKKRNIVIGSDTKNIVKREA